jgi:hypothetical protein
LRKFRDSKKDNCKAEVKTKATTIAEVKGDFDLVH